MLICFVFVLIPNANILCSFGLLHSYIMKNLIRNQDKTQRSYNKIVLFRIWRLAPSYIFMILTIFLLHAQGPLAANVRVYVENCEKYWWMNLLFINNFFDPNKICAVHTWYISADLQLFLISMVFIDLLIRSPRKGIIASLAVVMSGIVITMVWCWKLNIPPTYTVYRPDKEIEIKFMQIYMSPFPHIAPYFIGVFLGYFLADKKEVQISKLYQFIGWLTAFVCSMSMLFVSKTWNSGGEYTRLESVLYYTFGKIVYILGVAWMVFCCATGHGGIINYILSMKMWIPLARLSYATYLFAFILQIFNFTNKRYSYDFHEMIMIWQFFGDVVISSLMAMFIVLLVESPSIALQHLFLKKKSFIAPEIPKNKNEEYENEEFTKEPIENNILKINRTTEMELKKENNEFIPRTNDKQI